MDILETIFAEAFGPAAVAVLLGIMVATLVSGASMAQVSLREQKRRAEHQRSEYELRERILNRMSNGIEVTIKDFERFRNALALSQHQAKRVVDALYSEELSEQVTAEVIGKLDALLGELEAKQPYDNLPAEVRPALIRIEKTLSASPDEEDKAVLTPVVNALHSYAELLRQKGRLNFHRNIAYGIGAASLVVGLAALFWYHRLTTSLQELLRKLRIPLHVRNMRHPADR